MAFLDASTTPRPVRRRRFVSVGTKLAGAILAVVTLAVALLYFRGSSVARERLVDSKARAATMVSDLFTAGITAPLSFGDEPGVREHLALLGGNTNVVYAAVWQMAPDVHDSVGDKVGEIVREGFVADGAPTVHADVRIVPLPNAVMVERPVTSASGEVLGVIRIAFSLQQENALLQTNRRQLFGTMLGLGLGLVIVIVGLTRSLVIRRLKRLSRAAKRVEDGVGIALDEDALEANDEVGSLARALASMSEAIVQREAKIEGRNKDLRRVLDNVAEGLMTVDKNGKMSDERAKVLEDWFGPPADPKDFFAYFDQFAPETARWLRIGWTALTDDFVPVEVVLDQMPRRFEHHGKFFELDYLPIYEGEAIESVLVVVRDVTSNVERERAEQAQREAMNVFRRILDDRAGFTEFFKEAARLVEAIGGAAVGPVDVERVARDVHTLKGNCALYGIESVSRICHTIESRMHEEAPATPTPAERAQVRAAWASVEALTSELSQSTAGDRIELRLDEYEAHLRSLDKRRPHDEIAAFARTWSNELARERLDRIREQARSLARRLGKQGTEVSTEVTPPTLRLPADRWRAFWTVFAHVLRNTFDHGVEPTAERKTKGKPANGSVRIALRAERESVAVEVVDDGRGIAWEKIRESARKRGLPHTTPAELEEALFTDKVSSREAATETSGRGVGMGAVRETVRSCGGSIEIKTAEGKGTTLTFRFPLAMLEAPRRRSLAPVAKVAS